MNISIKLQLIAALVFSFLLSSSDLLAIETVDLLTPKISIMACMSTSATIRLEKNVLRWQVVASPQDEPPIPGNDPSCIRYGLDRSFITVSFGYRENTIEVSSDPEDWEKTVLTKDDKETVIYTTSLDISHESGIPLYINESRETRVWDIIPCEDSVYFVHISGQNSITVKKYSNTWRFLEFDFRYSYYPSKDYKPDAYNNSLITMNLFRFNIHSCFDYLDEIIVKSDLLRWKVWTKWWENWPHAPVDRTGCKNKEMRVTREGDEISFPVIWKKVEHGIINKISNHSIVDQVGEFSYDNVEEKQDLSDYIYEHYRDLEEHGFIWNLNTAQGRHEAKITGQNRFLLFDETDGSDFYEIRFEFLSLP